ncbi:MAG: D-aminoacylase [Armatimonas sp.]
MDFDVVLSGGEVLDGLGNPAIRADVGIIGERVKAIGDLSAATSGRRIDCSHKTICPGFIDIHTHSDLTVLLQRDLLSSLAQGVTSEVVGNCGFSLGLSTPDDVFALERRSMERSGGTIDWHTLSEFMQRVEDGGIAINIATLAGHGTLRKRVMGLAERLPDAAELSAMQRELAIALEAGAIGLSSGLEYVPGSYADVAELTALAKVAQEFGGFYATHLRDEGDFLEESVAEAIAVAEGAGIPLQLSHHKAEKPQNWGKIEKTLKTVQAARERGMDILMDQYPYTAYQTGLPTITLPVWAQGGTPKMVAERLQDPEFRARTRAAMTELDWNAVVIASCPPYPEYPGHSIAELARNAGMDPRDWVLDLLSSSEFWISAAHFAMSEEDVLTIMNDPNVCIGSDGVAQAPLPGADLTHPRTYGTFARILSHYVREKGVLTLAEAVRRMTSLPAKRLGWTERGRLTEGVIADIVVLDPKTVAESATFAQPHALALGIEHVFVAGSLAYQLGQSTSSRAGKILKNL